MDNELMTLNEKLNEYLNINQRDNTFQYLMLNKANDLAKIIMSNYQEKNPNYKDNININQSIQTVLSFFNKVKPEYAQILAQKISEGKLQVKEWKVIDGKLKNKSRSDKDAVILETSNTLDDAYTLVHEFTHTLSYNDNKGMIYQVFAESTAIGMENIMEDYLLKNSDISKEEIMKQKQFREKLTYNCALNVYIENTFIKDFKANGKVNEDTINNLINQGISKETILKNITSINNIQGKVVNLPYERNQKYVFGTMLASDFEQDYKKTGNINKLTSFVDIMKADNMNNSNYIGELKNNMDKATKSGIPLLDSKNITLSNEEKELLASSYKESFRIDKEKKEVPFDQRSPKEIAIAEQIREKNKLIAQDKMINKPKTLTLTQNNKDDVKGAISSIIIVLIIIVIAVIIAFLIRGIHE